MRLAEFILANVEPILVEWEAFARTIWPQGVSAGPAVLRDHAAEMLRATVADMRSIQDTAQQIDKSQGRGGGGRYSGAVDRASVAHASGRHGSGFELDAVIAEYRAVRASVVRLWRESNPTPNAEDVDDLTRFHEAIDQSLTEAVVEFTRLVDLESQERFRLFAEAAPGVLWIRSADTLQWEYLSPAFETIYERERSDVMGEGDLENWLDLIVPDDREHALRQIERVKAGERTTYEIRIRRPDGEIRWLRDTDFPLRDDEGEVRSIGGIGEDVTEQKRTEEHKRTIMAELNHRVKNTLATIDAIAQQTLEQAETMEEFADSFRPRLRSIAAAHSLLTRTHWTHAKLRDIVLAELSPRMAAEAQLRLDGPDVYLTPKAALAVHMVIHELSTNAAKYGALSSPEGRLSLDWRIRTAETPELVLRWREEGGPPVTRPRRLGFGSEMIGDVVEYELGGAVEREYPTEGFRCRLRMPLAAITPAGMGWEDAEGGATAVERVDRATEGASEESVQRILVVEDHVAIALGLKAALKEMGLTVVGPVGRLEEAMALAREGEIDAALLDVDLGGERSDPVADVLRERGIPFAVLTGFVSEELGSTLHGSVLFEKPVDPELLRGWVESVSGWRRVGGRESER